MQNYLDEVKRISDIQAESWLKNGAIPITFFLIKNEKTALIPTIGVEIAGRASMWEHITQIPDACVGQIAESWLTIDDKRIEALTCMAQAAGQTYCRYNAIVDGKLTEWTEIETVGLEAYPAITTDAPKPTPDDVVDEINKQLVADKDETDGK